MGGDADFYHGCQPRRPPASLGPKAAAKSPDAMLRMIRNEVMAVTKCHPNLT